MVIFSCVICFKVRFKVTEIKASLQADKLKIPVVGWCGDEMEIRAGLTWNIWGSWSEQ